jgi:adenylate cyclase
VYRLSPSEDSLAREQRKLAAIFAADVVSYSRLMGRDESGTLARLREHRKQRFEPTLARHGGRLVKLTGDGALAEFPSAVDAVGAAIEFQQAMTEANSEQPEDTRIVFRIGLHLGDLIVDGDDLYGDGVNVAARLEGEAPAGGIVISRTVHEAVEGRLKATFDDLGGLSLRNIERPVQAFCVKWEASDWKVSAALNVTPVVGVLPPAVDAPLTLPDKPSIAVLPFQNMSGDPEQEYFAEGVAEDIITELSRYRSLFVIARNSTFTYKGKAVDVRRVSRELGVQYVLEGSIRKAGNRVRVTAQLVDALTGNHLWAQRFDRVLDDIFVVQEEITRSIVSAVGREVEEARLAALSRTRPINLGAYEIGLRAWAQIRDLKLRPVNADPNAASAMAEQALAIDDRCVPALVALAQAHWHHGFYRTSPSPSASLDMAIDVASRAQDVDHLDHRPHLIKGLAHLAAGRHDDALFEAQRAHELNPNDPATLEAIGAIEARSGQTASGIERLMQALRINPLNPYQYVTHLQLAVACFLARNYAKGVEWAVLCKRAAPDLVMNLNILTVNYVGLGRIDEARKEFEVANRLAPELLKQRLATGSPMFKLQEDRQRDAQFLRVAAGLEDAPR